MEGRKRKRDLETKNPEENKKSKIELDREEENAGLYYKDVWPQVLSYLDKEKLRSNAAPVNQFFHRLSTQAFPKAPWPELDYLNRKTTSKNYKQTPKVFIFKDGGFAAGLQNGDVHFWNLKSKEPVVLKGHKKRIIKVFLLQNGDIVTHSRDNTILIWDRITFNKKHRLSRFQPHQSFFQVEPLENDDIVVSYLNGQIEVFNHAELWQKWKIIHPKIPNITWDAIESLTTSKNLIIAEFELPEDKQKINRLSIIKIWDNQGNLIKSVALKDLQAKMINSLQVFSNEKIIDDQYYFYFDWENLPPGFVVIVAHEVRRKSSFFLLNLLSDFDPVLIARNKKIISGINKSNELFIAAYEDHEIEYLSFFDASLNQFKNKNTYSIKEKPGLMQILSNGNLFFGGEKQIWYLWQSTNDQPSLLKLEDTPISGRYHLRSTDRNLHFSTSVADGIIFWDDDSYLIWDNPTGKFKLEMKSSELEFNAKQLQQLSNGDLLTMQPVAEEEEDIDCELSLHRFGVFKPEKNHKRKADEIDEKKTNNNSKCIRTTYGQ